MTIFTPALSCIIKRVVSNMFKRTHVCTVSLLTTWRLLMVSPPFPMTSPALEAGIIISWTVIPGPSLGLNAGAGRPFSTISVKSLFAVLKKSKAHHTLNSLRSGVTQDGIKATYWIDSGKPVNVTDLSGMPPLSTTKNNNYCHSNINTRPVKITPKRTYQVQSVFYSQIPAVIEIFVHRLFQ